ncbi:MAG: ribokinase [Marivibrio sp.]|uniref:ribokinase n=1 Tax=Marivibrio sp. TaxID=2039719 RepID=UPI0032EC8101
MIVVFGSINIDIEMQVERLPRSGETLLCRDYLLIPGGKGANQARAAALTGAKVRMFGKVGDDSFADSATEYLIAANVDLAGVSAAAAHTGVATVLVEPTGENCITVGAGANLEARADQVPDSALTPETTLLLQMEVTESENWRLVERAKKRGARVILNVAPAGMVPESVLQSIDVLVANEVEGAAVAREVGLEVAPASRIPRALAQRYALTCIITLGGAGLISFGPDGGWSVPGLPISAVDTTGAGDVFVGALAAALDRGDDQQAATRFAAAAAGLSCQKAGTQASAPTLEEVEEALPSLPESRRLA